MRIFTLVLSIVLFHNISFAKWTIIDSIQLGKLNDYIEPFYLDNNDNCWFTTTRREIYKFDGTATIYYDTNNTPLSFMVINCITQGQNGDMYFGNYSVASNPIDETSVIRFDGENWEFFNEHDYPMHSASVRDILVIGEDEFWMATFLGLYHYKNGKWNSYFEDENEYRRDINKLAIDKNNKLYIANNYRELYSTDLNKTNIKFNKITTPFTQQGGVLLCNVDSLNNLWLYHRDLQWRSYCGKKEGNNWIIYDSTTFDLNNPNNIYISRDKKTYCNTNKAVYEYKENAYWKKIFDIPSQINDNDKTIEIHNILNSIRLQGVDSKGNFWFNTGGRELVKYTPETNSVKKEINVKIYPNPSQNTIIINAEEPITKLALYSLNLSKINEYPANYTTTQEVDISTVPSGIYFIKVNDDLIKFVRE